MKSAMRLVMVGTLSCTLMAGCGQTRRASTPSPPTTSYQVSSFELRYGESSQTVRGASVTPIFFQVAKVSPLLGRGLLSEDHSSGRSQVVIVSENFWR